MRTYFDSFKRGWWIIIFIVLLVGGSGSLCSNKHECTAAYDYDQFGQPIRVGTFCPGG